MDGELYAAREELRVLGDRVARLMLSDPAAGAQLIPSLLQASEGLTRYFTQCAVLSHDAWKGEGYGGCCFA